jgi:hypothetical protein
MDFGISESKVDWKQVLVRMPPPLLAQFSQIARELNVPVCDLISFVLCFGQLKHGRLSREVLSSLAHYRQNRLLHNCYVRSKGVEKRVAAKRARLKKGAANG